jgi:uncharacterized protein (TIGR00730 family)
MRICVFCSAADVHEKYRAATQELGKLIATRGHSLVWGGSYKGLMKTIADSVQQNGGKVVGISVEHFRQNAYQGADEMTFAKDLAERKALLLHHSDALVALVGGTGTLDEIAEMMELKKYGVHQKPVAFLNTDGFYDGIKSFYERANKEGFLYFPLTDIVHFADTAEDLMRYIEENGKN